MKKREDRRDRTIRVAERRRREHLALVHPDGAVDCMCELSIWYFAKRRALSCDCRRRRQGRPKIGRGCCYAVGLRWTVVLRRTARREEQRLKREAGGRWAPR